MGTETEYAIDILEAPRNGKRLYDRSFLRRTSSKKDSMDDNRVFMNYNVDCIKKTMKMHEDVFKQQVRELHRLYGTQKALMDDLTREINRRKAWEPMMNLNSGPVMMSLGSHPAEERSASCSGEAIRAPEELVSGPTMINKNKLIFAEEEDDGDIELTLSIGSCKTRTESNIADEDRADTPVSRDRKQPHWLFHGLKLK